MGKKYPPSVVVLARQPRLDRLLAVRPIAQAQRHQGVEVLALARESYAAGFVITFQLQSHGGVPFIDNALARALRVTDDRGGQYPIQPAGATGEGARSEWQHPGAGCPCLPAASGDCRHHLASP